MYSMKALALVVARAPIATRANRAVVDNFDFIDIGLSIPGFAKPEWLAQGVRRSQIETGSRATEKFKPARVADVRRITDSAGPLPLRQRGWRVGTAQARRCPHD